MLFFPSLFSGECSQAYKYQNKSGTKSKLRAVFYSSFNFSSDGTNCLFFERRKENQFSIDVRWSKQLLFPGKRYLSTFFPFLILSAHTRQKKGNFFLSQTIEQFSRVHLFKLRQLLCCVNASNADLLFPSWVFPQVSFSECFLEDS